jgi:hypothetical protein
MVMLKRTGRRRSGTAVTIRTVAEQAGVSMMTVSNVITGTGKLLYFRVGTKRHKIGTRNRVSTWLVDQPHTVAAASRELAFQFLRRADLTCVGTATT